MSKLIFFIREVCLRNPILNGLRIELELIDGVNLLLLLLVLIQRDLSVKRRLRDTRSSLVGRAKGTFRSFRPYWDRLWLPNESIGSAALPEWDNLIGVLFPHSLLF